jgi:hypothetical protein
MKTRQGFVSNSSSSSFVVCLPDNLKFKDNYVQEALETLIAEGSYYEYENYDSFNALSDAIRPYVIASFDVDAGQIVVADKEKIRKIYEQKPEPFQDKGYTDPFTDMSAEDCKKTGEKLKEIAQEKEQKRNNNEK